MSRLDHYAQWLRANANKKGTPDFEAVASAYRALRSQRQPAPEQAGLVESFKEAATSLKAAPAAARFAAARTPEEQRAAREELLKITGGDEQLLTTSFAEVLKGEGSPIDWAKQVIGSSAGFLAAPFAAGAAGLAAGPVGGAVGLYGTLATQYTTQNLIRQAEEQARAEQEGRVAEETSVGKAVVAAGAATALDRLGFNFFKPILGKFPLVGKIFSEGDQGAKEVTDRIIEAHKNGSLTFKGGIAKGVAGGVAVEVPQEIAQTALERWQASLPLFNEEARGEYLEAAAGGALLGAGLGGARGASQISADRRRAEEALAEKAKIEKEEAEAKRKAEAKAAGIAEEKKPTVSAKSSATEEELTKAQEILTNLGVEKETKPLEFEVALIEGGIPQNRTRKILAALRKNKLLQKDDATGTLTFVPPVEVPAFVAPEGAGEFTVIDEGETAPAETAAEGALEGLGAPTEGGIPAEMFEPQAPSTEGALEGLGAPTEGGIPAEMFEPSTFAGSEISDLNRLSQLIINTGTGSDIVKDLYSADPIDAVLTNFSDLDTVSQKEIDQSKDYIKNISQEALRNQYGNEVTLYRGIKDTEDKTPVISYSLDKNIAKFNAEQQGVRTGKIEEIRVPVSEVLSYSNAISGGKGRFDEQEVIIPASARTQALKSRSAPAEPTTPAPDLREIALEVIKTTPTIQAISEATGLNQPKAAAIMRGFVDEGIVERVGNKFRLITPEAAGELTDVSTPAGTITGETVTQPSGAGAGVSVSREGAAGPAATETAVRGVEPIRDDLGRVDEGETAPQSTLAAEEWRDRVKQSKVKGALSPQSILDRINNLKAELGKYEPADVLTRNSRIEEIVGMLRQFGKLDDVTIQKRLRVSRKAAIDLLDDLQNEGIITTDSTLVEDASADIALVEDAFTVKDQQNRTAYDRFLQREETPLQELARNVDDIVDKYSESDIQNSTKTRQAVNDRLDVLEEYLAKQKEREAARAEREAAMSPRGLQETETQASIRAQEKIAAGEEVMSYSGSELRDAVNTKNANAVLEAIESRATQNQQAALSPESAEIQAEQAASRVRAPAVDTTGLTPEQAARKQRDADIRTAQERQQTKANVRADLDRVVSSITDPTSTATIKNEFLSLLARRLRLLDMSNVGIQVEGEADANEKIFNRLRAENKLAEYDPQTNTIYLREGSVSPKILLHEMVHAATVRILKLYSDPATRGQLNENQIEAAEHINELLKAAQKKLGGRFPDAFENVFEFVAYGMTDPVFQRELVRIRRPSLARYTKIPQDIWQQFTDALMRLFNLATPENLKKKAEYKSKLDKLNDAQRIYEEARRNPEGNLLLELSEAFEQILSAPEAGVDVPPLAARQRKGQKTRKPVAAVERTAEELLKASPKEREKYSKPTLTGVLRKFFFGEGGWENTVRLLQNDRRPLLKLQEELRRAELLSYDGPNANNLYDLIALSSGKAFQRMTESIKPFTDDVHRSIGAYAKATGLDIDDAVRRLSQYLTSEHEPERRRVKFLINVPLNNTTKFGSATLGVQNTAAGHRRYILEQLNNNFAAERKKLGRDLTAAERKSLAEKYRNVLEQLVTNYTDRNGESTTNAKPGTMPIDPDAREYDVVPNAKALKEINKIYKAELADPKLGPILKQMVESLNQVEENARTLNSESNYWSPPTENFRLFYGYKNYVTFRGRPESQVSEGDDRFELGNRRFGADYTEIVGPAEGRQSESDNVILSTLADGAKAAMRNGRIGVTQAIKNLIKDNHITGKLVKTIKFEDRYKEGNRPEQLRSPNRIFHYLPDGTIEVYQINDKRYSNAIRRTYEASNPLLEVVGKITSGIGQLHTRYNPAFYPYNFVRDALTNAFTMGAEMGPESATKYIGAVAAQIGKMGMVKTGRVAKMYTEGRLAELREMAKKDIDVRNVLEYLEEGGRVSYVQGLALQGQKEALLGEIGKKGFARRKEALDKWVDIWADSFEFTSRAAAYSVAKSNAIARGLPEDQARQEAASYAKNIANFEQIGEWGRGAGALFMFFRPAATGAVRAIDAIIPLFQDVDKAVRMLPQGVQSNPQALANYRKNFLTQRQNAKNMLVGLAGAGATLYLMAYMAADEDELGRNRVATDNMELWTRNLRLPLSFIGGEGFLQIPWGFGLGAFGAAGAQIMGVAVGKTDIKDMAVNLFTTGLDSFMPLPFSRISPLEDPTAWFVDSIMPSAVRPFVEYTMNVDGLGREIYLNRATKYGEAFTGGRGVPDAYKDLARFLFNTTDGAVSIQPNTMYFWMNNYLDGISRIGQSLYGAGLTIAGQKNFDAKEDLLVFRAYLGRKTNFDAREFAATEKKVLAMRERLTSLINIAEETGDPTQLQRYVRNNPNAPIIVEIYNKNINRDIKKIREASRAISVNKDLTRQQREEYLDQLDLHQNMLKRGLIEMFKQYDTSL